MMTLFEVAEELGRRLGAIFRMDGDGHRPVFGGTSKFRDDPNWRDDLLFYEYFHGNNGAGLGASHQTGWTGVIAKLIEIFGRIDAAHYLAAGNRDPFEQEGTEHRDLTPSGRG
jgi:hypothetical protein